MTEIWYQMKGECFIYHISTKLKHNDHLLTNYINLSNPTPKCISELKKYVFLLTFFLIDTCLMTNLTTKIDTDGKY